MSNLSDVGNLMLLYLDQIDPGEGTDAPEFLITTTAKKLSESGGRNWVPVIVKEVGENQYSIIGNFFIYAVAEAAGLEKVWCIIANSNPITEELARLLSRETLPKINLATATRDEIKAALQYLIEKPYSPLKNVDLLIATSRIDEAPRQSWKNLEPIIKLQCGINKDKLKLLNEVFKVHPSDFREAEKDQNLLQNLTVKELRDIAKKRNLSNYSKLKKSELIKLLV